MTFGERMRALMDERGQSLRGLAKQINYDVGYLSKIVNGRKPPSRSAAERIDAALDAGGSLVALLPRHTLPDNSAGNEADSALPWVWDPNATSAAIYETTMRDLTLDRRQAVKALTVTAGLPLIDPVQRWLSVAAGMVPDSPSAGRIGMEEVAQLETAVDVFRTWEHSYGGGLARKAVIGQLAEVSELLKDGLPGPIALRVFGVMARLAKIAANMSWDSGLQGVAQHYYVLGLQAAQPTKDRRFGAGILASMARQLLYLDRPGDALELVRLALDGTRTKGAGRLRAMLHTREAWAYAGLGRVEAFRRATGTAEEALTGASDDEGGSFDEAELAGVTGGRYLDLARNDVRFADEAVTYIQRAIDLRARSAGRSLALDYTGLAHAHMIRGDVDAAVIAGGAAAAAAGRVTSDRVRAQLRHLDQALAERPAAGVADLRARLQSATAN
ncbi:helix-turn-helix domain-containing protein [Planotetraspora sp. GP83]|uniref:helix-turn-helix domain-containing protein n=1 Tax=Planotetraspora sp. GP83 TaxID=3156264 RepID=UPI003516137A